MWEMLHAKFLLMRTVLCFSILFIIVDKQANKRKAFVSEFFPFFFLFEQKCVLNCWWNEHNASMHIWLGLIYLRQLCCQENHSKVEYLYRFFGSIFMINSLNPFGHNTKYTILSLISITSGNCTKNDRFWWISHFIMRDNCLK